MKSHFCMPTRMRPSRKSTRLSPMSLLDRFREAVFRLIMISALSKVSNTTTYTSTYDSQSSPMRSSSKSSPASTHRHRSYHHHLSDSHHTEAVADCIEFIKRSANEDIKGSIASNVTRAQVYNTSAEIVIPLPVM
ncbi:hypothetical protein R6Q57_011731 [Mikania cordata]